MPRFFQIGTPQSAYYKGILMRANPTLHEEAFGVLRRYCEPGARVVDVGAGQGAFSSRLQDAGYLVTAVDKNGGDFRAVDVDYVSVDFDLDREVENFVEKHNEIFDVAVGMEVIEHVENPWQYFRLLLNVVRPGGIVMITTPNPESSHSRVSFLFTGFFDHFSMSDYNGSGHINPLTVHELQLIANGTGAEILAMHSICRQPLFVLSRRFSSSLKSIIAAMLRPFMSGPAAGDILCLILRKPSPMAKKPSE